MAKDFVDLADSLLRRNSNPDAIMAFFAGEAALGAVGDGVSDASDALAKAAQKGQVITLLQGENYRVGQNIEVGAINNLGGTITIDENIVLTYGSVLGSAATVCFQGDGVAQPKNNMYSVGWYGGATLDEKWDFCSRGMLSNQSKTVIWPVPDASDPAAIYDGTNCVWDVANPLQFDDPHNNSIHLSFAQFFATSIKATPWGVIEYSATAKTEDISWPIGFDIDCGSNADYGILAHGGARMCHGGKKRIKRPRIDGIHINMDVSAVADCSEPEWTGGILEITKFGRNAVYIKGTGARAVLSAKFEKIFSNGARVIWGTAIVSGGNLTGVTLDADGPSGSDQDLTGHGWTGEVLRCVSKTGAARGATFTVTANQFGVAQSVTLAGGTVTGYTNGETVYLTAADAYVKLVGVTRECRIDDVYEYQDDGSDLGSPYDGVMIAENNSDGSSKMLEIGSIRTRLGRAPLLITRDTTATVGAKHSFRLNDFSPSAATYNTGAWLQISYVEGGSIGWACKNQAQDLVLQIDSTVANFTVAGIARERVSGNGDNVTYDGRQIYYVTSQADDTASVVRVRPPISTSYMGAVMVTCRQNASPNNAYHGEYQITEEGGLVAVGTPNAIFETFTGGLSTGTSGNTTDGKIGLSWNSTNGSFYIKNRLGEAYRTKVQFLG